MASTTVNIFPSILCLAWSAQLRWCNVLPAMPASACRGLACLASAFLNDESMRGLKESHHSYPFVLSGTSQALSAAPQRTVVRWVSLLRLPLKHPYFRGRIQLFKVACSLLYLSGRDSALVSKGGEHLHGSVKKYGGFIPLTWSRKLRADGFPKPSQRGPGHPSQRLHH